MESNTDTQPSALPSWFLTTMLPPNALYDNILSRLSVESNWTEQNESVRYPIYFWIFASLLNWTRQAVLEPFTFITSNPGKDMRGRLIEAFNLWLNVPQDRTVVIARIVNMLHAASLMCVCVWFIMHPKTGFWLCLRRVDDIEDDSQLRRGRPGQCLIDQESPFINSFSCCSRPQSLWCPTNHQHCQLRLLSCLSGAICLGKVITHFRRRSGSPCDSQWYGCLPHEQN